MTTIELEIKEMGAPQAVVACFESVDDALTWLRDRPRFTEVIRVVGPPRSEDVVQSLRDAMRPLDDEERRRKDEIYEAELAEIRRRNLEEDRQAKAEAAGSIGGDLDPDRPMVVEWHEGRGFSMVDPTDDRPIPARVQSVVEAWIDERDGWLHPRRQHVGSATLTVWPGPIPGGREADRIEPGGQFMAVPGTRER